MGRLMKVKEAAERLALCEKTVYGLISEGALPGYKFSGAVRVDEDDLTAYMEQSRVRPSPPPAPKRAPGRPKGSTAKHRDPRWYDAPDSVVYTGLSCLARFKTGAS